MNDNEERKYYFEYKPDDLEVVDSICDVCIYKNGEDPSICEKFPDGKPVELLDPDAYCHLFSSGIEL